MDTPTFQNLDLACAKLGKDLAKEPTKDLENLITNALAVLEEQGIYALFLYLKSKNNDLSDELCKFLKKTPKQSPLLSGEGKIFKLLQQLAGNLDNLLLARDLVHQSLVYARHHARLGKDGEAKT